MAKQPAAAWEPVLGPKQKTQYLSRKRYQLLTGPRRCMSPDTHIFTPSGAHRLSDFKENLRAVTSWNGLSVEHSPATQFHSNPSRSALKVTLSNGKSLVMSPEHAMWCCYSDGASPAVGYLKAEGFEHMLSGGVYLPMVANRWSDEAPYQSVDVLVQRQTCRDCGSPARTNGLCPMHFMRHKAAGIAPVGGKDIENVPIDEPLSYALGAMCGDGCCNIKDNRSLHFSNTDHECLTAVDDALQSLAGGLSHVGKCDYTVHGNLFRGVIRALKMDVGAHEKSIPDEIFKSPRPVIASFLSGLFDTDGCQVANGRDVRLSTVSRRLADDVQDALSMFGILAVLKESRVKYNGEYRRYFLLSLPGEHARKFCDEIGFKITRKQDRRSKATRASINYGLPHHVREHLQARKDAMPSQTRRWHRERRWFGVLRRYTPTFDKVERFVSEFGSDDFLTSLMASRTWLRVVKVEQVESDLVDISVDRNESYIAAGFPSHNSTKSFSAGKSVIRHAWETPNAMVGVLATQMSAGKVGPWQLLFAPDTGLIHEWVNAGLAGPNGEFEILKQGYDPTTRAPYVRIRNYWGSESTFTLISLDNEADVEKKFLGTVFTCLWVSELQNFKDPRVFTVLKEQLRAHWIPYEAHLWIADTNPPEEGEAHWAYDFWFRQRLSEEPPLGPDGNPIMSLEDFISFRDDLELFEFDISDNIFEDPRSLASLRASYANDPEAYDRFILGKWTKGAGHATKWFSRSFRTAGPKPHVVVSYDGLADLGHLLPEPDVTTLHTGWDTGATNHAFAILQRRNGQSGPEWDILDEVVSIKQEVMLDEFANACNEQMILQESRIPRFAKIVEGGRRPPLNWVSWGDTSLSKFQPNTAQGNDAIIIEGVCDGRVRMQFATEAKKPHSVYRRIMLLKDLLEKDRLFVSANCAATIEMFQQLKRGDSRFSYTSKGDPNKHIFDAISYVIYMEMFLSGDYKVKDHRKSGDDPAPTIFSV